MPSSTRAVTSAELTRFVRESMQCTGVPDEDAAVVADCLVAANLAGVDTHGVVRLAHYVERLKNRTITTCPRMVFERRRAALGILDGDHGLGHVVATRAADEVAAMAGQAGTASVLVRNSSHFGMAGYYVRRIVRSGCAGMVMTATDAFLIPFGAGRPFFGTNPISVGVPTGSDPLVLDMSTTSIPWGNLALAQKEGRKIPPTWGLDAGGEPCDDPPRIRGLHPIAGPKGSGLAMIIDTFSNLFGGMAWGPHIVQMYGQMERRRGLGHFFAAWDIGAMDESAGFLHQMDAMIDELHSLPTAPGHERVRYPGEIEALTTRRRAEEGIPVEPGLAKELDDLGERLGIAKPIYA